MSNTNTCFYQFTHVETNRLLAYFFESDIAKLTKDLAASFESMAKSFGLYFNIDIPSDQDLACQMKQKVFLDNEMYEKILFNLCKYKRLSDINIIIYLTKINTF